MNLTCITVDDEPLALRLLADHISKLPNLKLLGSFTNPLEALVAVGKLSPDIIFLDIQMPELNGIQFMQIVEQSKSKIIVTSAYPEYAIAGYEHNVADYLLKPVPLQRFIKAVERVRTMLKPSSQPIVQDAHIKLPHSGGYIFVKVENKLMRVELDNILYIEGLKNYVYIHTDQNKILTLQVMKQLEELLPSNRFVRVHKSYIVAINKIKSVERIQLIIGDTKIPVGATYAERFFKILEGLKD
ncbi:MAG TPA: LytTR family DNA-binding domain-containing protein [Phnomibacter sp.]|nr:LytTR family DNA-binding domain-containing protein [Phnomibacter sp.]